MALYCSAYALIYPPHFFYTLDGYERYIQICTYGQPRHTIKYMTRMFMYQIHNIQIHNVYYVDLYIIIIVINRITSAGSVQVGILLRYGIGWPTMSLYAHIDATSYILVHIHTQYRVFITYLYECYIASVSIYRYRNLSRVNLRVL